MSEVTSVSAVTREFLDGGDDDELAEDAVTGPGRIPPGVQIYEINGPFFFGAAERFKDALSVVSAPPRVLILRMRHVSAMDSTGMHALRALVRRARHDGTLVLLSGVHMQPLVALRRSGMLDDIGEDALCDNLEIAVRRARAHLGDDPDGQHSLF